MLTSLGKFVGALLLILFALMMINHRSTTIQAGVNHLEPGSYEFIEDFATPANYQNNQFDDFDASSVDNGSGKKFSGSMHKELAGFDPKVH